MLKDQYQNLRSYIDALFADAATDLRTTEIKEEILQNITDKYNDKIKEGKSEEAAFNIAVASIGDISELLNELKHTENLNMSYKNNGSREENVQKSAFLSAIAIALFVFCIVPQILMPNKWGTVMMFSIAAIATGLLIYKSTLYRKNPKNATIAEDFRQWRSDTSSSKHLFKSLTSVIWTLSTAAYFIISFATMAWHITWIIFLIAAAVNSILKAIMDISR